MISPIGSARRASTIARHICQKAIRRKKTELKMKFNPWRRISAEKRNWIVSGVLATLGLLIASYGQARASEKEMIDALSAHYAQVPTMSGEFLQFGPKGEQSGGKFYIKRPGKVRFDYDDPSPLEVVSNGLAVMVVNNKLKTFESYPLDKTPLRLLLDKTIDLSGADIMDIKQDGDVTTIVMGDKQVFGDSVITLMFDPNTFELRQWTIKDAQGKETSVMIFNVQNNVQISDRAFQINKAALKRKF